MMDSSQKKILLNMAYYTLIGLILITSVFFILRTIYNDLPIYLKIIYYIWSALLLLNIVYDVLCTFKKGKKFIPGIILFVLTLLCTVLAIDILIMNGVSFKSITIIEISYFIDTSLNFLPIYLSVFAFIFGEKIISFDA